MAMAMAMAVDLPHETDMKYSNLPIEIMLMSFVDMGDFSEIIFIVNQGKRVLYRLTSPKYERKILEIFTSKDFLNIIYLAFCNSIRYSGITKLPKIYQFPCGKYIAILHFENYGERDFYVIANLFYSNGLSINPGIEYGWKYIISPVETSLSKQQKINELKKELNQLNENNDDDADDDADDDDDDDADDDAEDDDDDDDDADDDDDDDADDDNDNDDDADDDNDDDDDADDDIRKQIKEIEKLPEITEEIDIILQRIKIPDIYKISVEKSFIHTLYELLYQAHYHARRNAEAVSN
jgi:hypothetical protein